MKCRFLSLCILLSTGLVAQHNFNGAYKGVNLDRIAFPIGGLGAGMFCLEGSGAVSHFSIAHRPAMMNEPPLFATLWCKSLGRAKVLEGPVPGWKKFGMYNAALGAPGATWGLERCSAATSFTTRFPFADIALADKDLPVKITLTGWSPFIPTDADNSSLPAGAFEYTFTNSSKAAQSFVFAYSAKRTFDNFSRIDSTAGGFVFSRDGSTARPDSEAHFAVVTDEPGAVIDYSWFRGSWFDPLTIAWKHISEGTVQSSPPREGGSGASLMVPFDLKPGQSKTIRVLFGWYVPRSHMRFMWDPTGNPQLATTDNKYYRPWYAAKFAGIEELLQYWKGHYTELRQKTNLFTEAFYKSSLPPEVLEAVSANLTILKSPTVLRQYDGRFWGWEGCEDQGGSCPGSCTHVWNYAQALSHLFPALERSMRETEFGPSQDSTGHQMFRSALPIRPLAHNFYAAADGQLGGIMKVYRDWRISGNSDWMKELYPHVKQSLDYCIASWDPDHNGTITEPHHNTYDIEFWGPEGMCTGFYLGALEAFIAMSDYLHEEDNQYKALYEKGKAYMETRLFNGQYFYQQVQWTGLHAPDPITASKNSLAGDYSEDALAILHTEGPKYQYGTGVLSDGVLGTWMARVCGLPAPVDTAKINRHLASIYQYNFKKDLSDHSNPQRPTYAIGNEGGLLLCSWPRGGKPSLPFPYSDEVWTGIEYQVASHLIFAGQTAKGLDIVRAARHRYDGRVRNPFDEYECGHWYARAMSSYALLEALTGVRYDAVEKTLYVSKKAGNFTSFLSTDTGFGNVTCHNGKVTLQLVYGNIDVGKIVMQ